MKSTQGNTVYLIKSSCKLVQTLRHIRASLPLMWTVPFPELSRKSIASLTPAFTQTLTGLKRVLHGTERIFPHVELW